MQGSKGILRGVRQEGQTGEVTRAGPERYAVSKRIVSLALTGRVVTSPLPLPWYYGGETHVVIITGYTSIVATLSGKHFVFGLWIFWWSGLQKYEDWHQGH